MINARCGFPMVLVSTDRAAERWAIRGSRLLHPVFGGTRGNTNDARRTFTRQSGSPAMGIVKLLRARELGFHFCKSDEVASKRVRVERFYLWNVLPRVHGRLASL